MRRLIFIDRPYLNTNSFFYFLFFCFTFFSSLPLYGTKLPELTPKKVNAKIDEILKSHASYKTLTPLIIERSLQNFVSELDPTKTYFIKSDIEEWLKPTPAYVQQVLTDFQKSNFKAYEQIYWKMRQAIDRRHRLDKEVDDAHLPKATLDEFKDMDWAANEQELLERLKKMRYLQLEVVSSLSPEVRDLTLQRIAKRQARFEEEIVQDKNPTLDQLVILTKVLKSVASALDTHTWYFTPEEAMQFMIAVQQRLFGIGVQLRDDLNGFTLVKIVPGGPAALGRELKAKDRIIAVNGEPVVGMDINDAVELIRGEENTPVMLTVIREADEEGLKKEEKLDIKVMRGEVVLKETRLSSSSEPFGDGILVYLHLYSFYQDPHNSSALDLRKEIERYSHEAPIKGIILDLRSNSGGLLSQAVDVAGLFITKGIVVSIKDNTGAVQNLREIENHPAWTGPLIVLVNRMSASASEIVAQSLQDYGRAIIVGDKETYGKGSFQTFTLNTSVGEKVNPEGEYKVTRGRYYTVSGKTPQLKGVIADIVVPGPLSEMEIGERYAKYPLEGDKIPENFEDDLADIPFFQRSKVKMLYRFDLQKRLTDYTRFLPTLKENSAERISGDKDYQNFLKEIKRKDGNEEDADLESFGQNDLQLHEAYNILKDLVILRERKEADRESAHTSLE